MPTPLLIILIVAFFLSIPLLWAMITKSVLKKKYKNVEHAKKQLESALFDYYEVLSKHHGILRQQRTFDQSPFKKLVEWRAGLKPPIDIKTQEHLLKEMFKVEHFLLSLEDEAGETMTKQSPQIRSRYKEALERISDRKRTYNGRVSGLNAMINAFPHNLMAKAIKLRPRPFFNLSLPAPEAIRKK